MCQIKSQSICLLCERILTKVKSQISKDLQRFSSDAQEGLPDVGKQRSCE
ncbi:hypothetical protein KTAU_44690 [Thermogemmatispora aurantia]|uniref:Uncharacterized protein n=1 Tax=Thermogemmatispora aurantia TaxID=2045279 RepID=A0A5J4KEZ7_9CHLR|nr:hypothetical protein KTAU_44690 [Thermogemmatispora aurantia]